MKNRYCLAQDQEIIRKYAEYKVVTIEDYTKLISFIVRSILEKDYVLMASKSTGKTGHFQFACRTNSVEVYITSWHTESGIDPITHQDTKVDNLIIIIAENKDEIFRRTFYLDNRYSYYTYKTRKGRLYDSYDEYKRNWDVQIRRAQAYNPKDEQNPTTLISPQSPRWGKYVETLLPIIKTRRGFKKITADAVQGIRYQVSSNNGALMHQTRLQIWINTKGKKKPLCFENVYDVPQIYKDLHEIKRQDEVIQIYGNRIPIDYVKHTQYQYNPNKRIIFMHATKNGKHIGYFIISPHQIAGVTYAFTDTEGQLLDNGYLPYNVYYRYKSERDLVERCMTLGKIKMPSVFEDAKFIDTTESYILPLSLAILVDDKQGKDAYNSQPDLAATDKRKWNAIKPFVCHDDDSIYLYGKPYILKKCDTDSFGRIEMTLTDPNYCIQLSFLLEADSTCLMRFADLHTHVMSTNKKMQEALTQFATSHIKTS